MGTNIHPTAIIETGAQIGADTEVGPYSIVRKNVKIGKGTRLLSHVIVEGLTDIGEDCIIYPHAVIGLPPQDLKYKDEPTRLTIGNGNIIREYTSIHRASVGGSGVTSIGNGNFLMAYVHVAHDCRIGNKTILANAVTLAGHVVIEDYAFIGGVVAIHQFTRIGRNAMVGGFSGIVQDIPPFMIAAGGTRAKLFGPNTIGLKRHGYSEHSINDIKKAYKTIFREKLTLQEALKKAREAFPESAEVNQLITFIEANKRGICR